LLRVFLSHSHVDIDLTADLKKALEAEKFEPYVAQLEPSPGTEIPFKITQYLRSSDCLVVILTAAASQSQWVQQEIGFATALKKLIIPIVEKGVSPKAFIQINEYIELDRVHFDRTIGELVKALRNLETSLGKLEYTPGKVATLLGKSYITIRRWISDQKIRASKIEYTNRYVVKRSELEALRSRNLPVTTDVFARDVIALVETRKIVYLRECQVAMEDSYNQDDTYDKLTELVANRRLETRIYRGNRWYYTTDTNWSDIQSIADEKIGLLTTYSSHPRAYTYKQIKYSDYAEFLVEWALVEAGFIIVAKETYYFNRNIFLPNAGPGRPQDLDFIALSPTNKVFVGIQVKNKLEYPKPADTSSLIDICNTLHLRPVLVTRNAHPMTFLPIQNSKGFIIVFKRYLLQPPFDRAKFKKLVYDLEIPIGVYQTTPDFLIRKFIELDKNLKP
jgi:hypothetical protein